MSIHGELLIRGKARIDLVELGQGWDGEYDPNDPHDTD